jgi:hypothetical protein
MVEMTTTPSSNGEKPLAKRAGARTILPTTWTDHEVRLQYVGADGLEAHAKGVFLDWCPSGPILNIEGVRTVIFWERIAVLELVGD